MERAAFVAAAESRGIDPLSAGALFDDLHPTADVSKLRSDPTPFGSRSGLSRVVVVSIWIGTILLIGAHAWWCTRAYDAGGAGAVLALTVAWQLAFLAAAEWARRNGYTLLDSGFAAVVAFYMPLTAFSFERLLGFGFHDGDFDSLVPYASGGWLFLELASVAVAALLLRRYRRPFLMLPLTLFSGFLVVDATIRAAGGWEHDRLAGAVLLFCGALVLAAAVALDHRGWRRFAFWPHLVAMATLVGGLQLVWGGHERASLLLAAAVAVSLGLWLARVAYLAAAGALGWAALVLSAHGGAFPFVLLAGGLAFIGLAIWLARSDSPVRRWLAARELPAPQRDLAY